jgi:tripartite-type tricarboxylate transporter receptor subunit TctC
MQSIPRITPILRVIGLCLALTMALLAPADADELDALKGKTIRGIVGSNAGSTTDTVARGFFDRLKDVLPDTTIRVQNVAGSGGARAVVELQSATGSVVTVGIFNYGSIYTQLLADGPPPYDLSRLHLVGSLTGGGRLLAVRRGLGAASFDATQELARQPIIGTGDALSTSTLEALLLNATTSVRFKVIQGMPDEQADAMLLAGHTDAVIGNPFDLQGRIDAGDLVPVLRFSETGYAKALDQVPIWRQFVRADVPEGLTFLIDTLNKSGRTVAASPTTEPAVVAGLRAAFDKVVADPGYLQGMLARDVVIDATPGAELGPRLQRVLGSGGNLGSLLKTYLDCGRKVSDAGAKACN